MHFKVFSQKIKEDFCQLTEQSLSLLKKLSPSVDECYCYTFSGVLLQVSDKLLGSVVFIWEQSTAPSLEPDVVTNQPCNPLCLRSVHCISIHLYKVSLYFSERDWEDIRKMPEHGTLQKDFRKAKYEFPPQTLCLLDSLSPIGKGGKYQNYSFRFG